MTQRLNPYTTAPEAITALTNVERYIHGCGLEPGLVLLIKTRVSQMNGCEYCLHLHTEEARSLGETEARLYLLDAWRQSQLYSARERAALKWAESVTRIAETRAPDDDYEEVRRHFSEKEAADLSVVVGMINLWNRLAIGVRMVHPSDRRRVA
jgi:AhpD family alkylhydroperoxidase